MTLRDCPECGVTNDMTVNPRRCYSCREPWTDAVTRYDVSLGPRRFSTTSPHVAETFSRLGATVTATTGAE